MDAIQNSQNKVGKINIAIEGYIFIIISCGMVCVHIANDTNHYRPEWTVVPS